MTLIAIIGISRGLALALTEHFIQSRHTVLGYVCNLAVAEKLNQKFGLPHNFTAVNVSNEQRV